MARFRELMQWVVDRSQEDLPEQFDPMYRDPTSQQILEMVASGAWAQADALVAESPEQWFLIDRLACARESVPTDTFQEWAERVPTAVSHSLVAQSLVRDAARQRGQLGPSVVGAATGTRQLAILQRAREHAVTATELDDSSPSGWAALVSIEKGLGNDMVVGHDYFLAAHARAPFDPGACLARLDALSPRWGGTTEGMFAFARWIQHDAPAGSPARAALPMAHIDHAIRISQRDWGQRYFGGEDVAIEINAGLARFLDASPGHARPTDLLCLNAYLFTLTPGGLGQSELGQQCLSRVDDRPTEFPWTNVSSTIPEAFATGTAWIVA